MLPSCKVSKQRAFSSYVVTSTPGAYPDVITSVLQFNYLLGVDGRLQRSMTVPPLPSHKPEEPISPKPYPPTSIHSLSNPDTINYHRHQRRPSLQNWTLPLPASKNLRAQKNVSSAISTVPVDVSSEFVNNCTIGFPFSELHSAVITSGSDGSNLFSTTTPIQFPSSACSTNPTAAAVATVVHPQQSPIPIAETSVVPTVGEGFLEGVAVGGRSGHASRLSVAYPRNSLYSAKSFDRANPPSSPLSSGSGNIVQSKSGNTPVYGLYAKRDQGLYSMTYPQHGQPSPTNVPLPQQYAQHNNDNPDGPFVSQQTHNYHDGNATYLSPMPPNFQNIGQIDSNAMYGTERANVPSIHNIGSTGTGSSSDHFHQMQLYHEQQQQQQQQQSKLSQELFQRRQAERAARNRESSRRAREKAKHRFRTLEMDNFNLRETVRTLRMQNEYLHAQFERLASIQQGCHICRYKTVAIPPPPPPRAQSPPLPPGAPSMHQ